MTRPVFIGDEISATGYRLAGAQVMTPERTSASVRSALEEARAHADFVMLTQEYAQALPPPVLDAALAALMPPLVIVPDVRDRVPLADIATRLRGQLGVEE